MLHNAWMRTKRYHACQGLILLGPLVLILSASAGSAETTSRALHDALKNTQASGLVVDLETGAVRAREGKEIRATPGSTLKPLLLEYALEHGVITEHTQVFCRRDLRIGARSLPCTHPADQDVFTSENGLAESCNSYFAEVGRRFSGAALDGALQQSHIPHRSLRAATADARALAVLGLEGVNTSPLELAEAYRQLALSMPRDGAVARGLAGSVRYGMAHPAFIPGVALLGKTGTASDDGRAWTHGWFAGILPGRLVIVIYVPHGDGGTAARLARAFLISEAVTHP